MIPQILTIIYGEGDQWGRYDLPKMFQTTNHLESCDVVLLYYW